MTHSIEAGFIESFVQRYPSRILETLLCDRTTGKNIIWADGEYEELGDGYGGDDEITVELITGARSGVVKPRVAKELERIGKELEKARKNLAGIEGKLSNEKFTARAPEAVVNAEREKAQKARDLIESLRQSEEALKNL